MCPTSTGDETSPPRLDERITLIDRRTLCYAEFGDPDGYPVIAIHGFPGCRLDPWPHHRLLARNHIRLISPDRPGSGHSTFQPSRRVLDFPSDMLELADHLGLGRFGVLGISGGGPYAVACARYIPSDRISVLGLLAPATPWEMDGEGPSGLRMISRLGDWAVRHVPRVVSAILTLVISVVNWGTKQGWVINMIDKNLNQASKAQGRMEQVCDVLSNEKHRRMLIRTLQDNKAEKTIDDRSIVEQRHQAITTLQATLRQGSKPIMQEAQILLHPWGFDLTDVKYDPIQIWHGSKDVHAPSSQCRIMAGKLPHAVLKEYEMDHLGMLAEMGMVLDELITDMVRSDTMQ